jgi:lipopolysaccharide transport system permease protein
MGPLYGGLFGSADYEYYLYLATGIVAWYYFSGTLGESATAFTAHEVFIKQTSLPLTVYILRICVRNLIILAHNLIILFGVYFWVAGFSLRVLLILPVIGVLFLLLYLLSIIIAFFCARFRDLIPLVSNFLQLAMFLTPVFWVATASSGRQIYTQYNPFYYLISAFRAPFGIMDFNVVATLSIASSLVLLFIVDWLIIKKFGRQVVYWV